MTTSNARGADGGDDRAGEPQPRHRMVARIAEILETVAREPAGLTLTEIAQRVGAPLSSVQGLTNGLVETGYLTRQERRYSLGPAPYVLNVIAQRPPIHVVKHSDLELLHGLCGQTVLLGIVVGAEIIYIDHVTDDPRHAYLAETHKRRPLLRTVCGRAILAHAEKHILHEALRTARPEEKPLIEPFLLEIPAIRETKLAMARDLAAAGFWAVATPVFEGGRVVAAVGVSGTPERMGNGQLEKMGSLLLEHVPAWSRRSLDD